MRPAGVTFSASVDTMRGELERPSTWISSRAASPREISVGQRLAEAALCWADAGSAAATTSRMAEKIQGLCFAFIEITSSFVEGWRGRGVRWTASAGRRARPHREWRPEGGSPRLG